MPRRVSLDLRMFSAGGLALCDAIARQGYDTLAPPAGARAARPGPHRRAPRRGARCGAPVTLDEAYEACRDIARVEARNFYYGFILLPPERRAGIYAAYAFSRRADDSVDDEGSATRRLAAVADRRDELDACYAGEPPADDPVLVALADTVRASRSRASTSTPCWTAWRWTSRSRATRTSRRSRSTATAWPAPSGS